MISQFTTTSNKLLEFTAKQQASKLSIRAIQNPAIFRLLLIIRCDNDACKSDVNPRPEMGEV